MMGMLDVVAAFAAIATLALGAAAPSPALAASSGAPYVPFPTPQSPGRAAPFIDALNARNGLPPFERLPSAADGVVIATRPADRERVPSGSPSVRRSPKVLRRAGVAAGAGNPSVPTGVFFAVALVLIALAAAAIAGGRSASSARGLDGTHRSSS